MQFARKFNIRTEETLCHGSLDLVDLPLATIDSCRAFEHFRLRAAEQEPNRALDILENRVRLVENLEGALHKISRDLHVLHEQIVQAGLGSIGQRVNALDEFQHLPTRRREQRTANQRILNLPSHVVSSALCLMRLECKMLRALYIGISKQRARRFPKEIHRFPDLHKMLQYQPLYLLLAVPESHAFTPLFESPRPLRHEPRRTGIYGSLHRENRGQYRPATNVASQGSMDASSADHSGERIARICCRSALTSATMQVMVEGAVVSNLRDRVQGHFGILTRVQKNLIQSILTDYEEYIFLSVDEAAKQLSVHKSTLVRLAQSLEYDGYTELRGDLQELYRQEITPGEKLGKTLSEVQIDNLYQQVVETEILYLKDSLKTIHNEDIHKAAELIAKARRVFICGRGPQGPLAELFEFRLRRLGVDVLSITDEGRAILERLQLLAKDDLLVLFSFLVVPLEHQHAISLARDVGCPAVLITDSVAKEMLDHVTVTLAARRGPATIYHTNMVPLAIVTAIILDIAKQKGPDAIAALGQLQELRRRFGYEYRVVHHHEDAESG